MVSEPASIRNAAFECISSKVRPLPGSADKIRLQRSGWPENSCHVSIVRLVIILMKLHAKPTWVFRQPSVNSINCVAEVGGSHLCNPPRLHELKGLCQPRVVFDDMDESEDLDAIEDSLDPRRVRVVLEQAERFPEGEVIHYVKSSEVEHLGHVHRPSPCLVQVGYQKVNEFSEERFLLLQVAI